MKKNTESLDKISLKEKKTIEQDPSGRFQRFDEFLSLSENTVRYKAYDRQTGLEVSWHEVIIKLFTKEQKARIISKAERLKTIHCSYVNFFLHYWLNNDSTKLFYITESVSSVSIYINVVNDVSEIRAKVIAKWFRPVLEALEYLHGQCPPILHNRLCLSTIFIKPTSGSIKLVSPLLLDTPYQFSRQTKLRLTTPPEYLRNDFGTYSDIWSFGLAVLFAVTKVEPYSECKTPMGLIKKLSNCEPPESLSMVTDRLAFNLILSCFKPANQRPSASDLLKHPFFSQNFDDSEDNTIDNQPDDGFVVIFSGKPTRSNDNIPTLGPNDNVRLQDTGKLALSTPRIGHGKK